MTVSLNTRFSEIRKALHMTQETFGNELGLNKSSISNIEKNLRNVTDKHIKLLCSTFNVNEEWLRTGNGTMFSELSEDEELNKIIVLATKPENQKLKEALLLLPKLTDDQLVFLAELIKKISC